MDIDAFCVAHRDEWERLDTLVARRHLSSSDVDELITLYRSAARDLSRLRTGAPDPQLIAAMSTRVAAARGRINGGGQMRWSDLRRFVTVDMPAALYRIRWWTAAVAAAEIFIALVSAMWMLGNPEAMALLGPEKAREIYAHQDFESYYTMYEAKDFAAMVWTNNARLAALCVASGITGIIPAWFLFTNALSIGQAGAIMADQGMTGTFFSLILPHGLLELTCVFIAGAAGIKLFWTLLVPGPWPRSQALAREGRSLMTVAVAMAAALGVAGLIEAFVTPAPVPWALKCVVGVLAFAVLWAYTLGLGKRAVEAGYSGDMLEDAAGAYVPVLG